MELTEYQHEQLQIAMELLETLSVNSTEIAKNSKERNQCILLGVLTQGFCCIIVVYLIALYIFQLSP